MLGIGDGVVLHRIGFAQARGRRIGSEQALVVACDDGDGCGAIGVESDYAALRVVGILADPGLQPPLQGGLPFLVQRLVVRGAGLALRPLVKDAHGLAMQPVSAPVRRDIAPVAPDRAELHAANGLPDLAAGLDLGAGVDHLAVRGDHALWHRRRLAVDFAAGPEQDGK